MSDLEKTQSPWYQWPRDWMKDQGFWREVTTRTMAAVFAIWITAFITSIALGLGGFLSKNEGAWTVLAIILIVSGFGIGFLVAALFFASALLNKKPTSTRVGLGFATLVTFAGFLIISIRIFGFP